MVYRRYWTEWALFDYYGSDSSNNTATDEDSIRISKCFIIFQYSHHLEKHASVYDNW